MVEIVNMPSIHETTVCMGEKQSLSLVGTQFNQYTGKFVKFLTDDMLHNGFQFKTGLNVDTNDWIGTIYCQNGIYFTTVESAPIWSTVTYREHKWIMDVEVPNDARVSVFNNKIKADRVILSNPRLITDMPEWKTTDEKDWNYYTALNHLNLRFMHVKHFPLDVLRQLLKRFESMCDTWQEYMLQLTKLNDQFQILACEDYPNVVSLNFKLASPLMQNYMEATAPEQKIMESKYLI